MQIHDKRFLASMRRFPTEPITEATPETIDGSKAAIHGNLRLCCGEVSTVSYNLYDSFANKSESLDRSSLTFCILDFILPIIPPDDPPKIEPVQYKYKLEEN